MGSHDHVARPLLPLRHFGQDGHRVREENAPVVEVELGQEASHAECRQGQEVVGYLGPEVGLSLSTGGDPLSVEASETLVERELPLVVLRFFSRLMGFLSCALHSSSGMRVEQGMARYLTADH